MVEITVPMIAIYTIVIEKKEEYLRFHHTPIMFNSYG